MKKIRFLFLITLILITCTGCDVEYNIHITKNDIEETINVTDYITPNRTQEDILNHYNMWYPTFVNFIKKGETIEIEDFSEKVDNIEYHDKTIQRIEDGYKYKYKYKYDIDEYYDSYVLASVFSDINVHKEYDKLVIRTSKENFLCSHDYFDVARVNITFDTEIYEINHTNTTNIRNNKYTWILNRDNCNDSEIVLTLNRIKKEGSTNKGEDPNELTDNNEQKNNQKNSASDYTLYIFYAILLILILIGYLLFNKIKKKYNQDNEDV